MMIRLLILYPVYRGCQDVSKSNDFPQSELLFNKLITRQPKHAETTQITMQTSTQNTRYKIKALPLLPSHDCAFPALVMLYMQICLQIFAHMHV